MLGNYINPLIQTLETNGYSASCEHNPRGLTLRILDARLNRETSLGLDPLRLDARSHRLLVDYCTPEQLASLLEDTAPYGEAREAEPLGV